jgi:hypothetical protein
VAENWKKEYDIRQYRLMADQLQRFAEGKLDLASLVGSLKALLSVLEATDETWKDDFRSEWGTLETVYALALDRKERGLDSDVQTAIDGPSDQALISEAVQNMLRLVEDRLGSDRSLGG